MKFQVGDKVIPRFSLEASVTGELEIIAILETDEEPHYLVIREHICQEEVSDERLAYLRGMGYDETYPIIDGRDNLKDLSREEAEKFDEYSQDQLISLNCYEGRDTLDTSFRIREFNETLKDGCPFCDGEVIIGKGEEDYNPHTSIATCSDCNTKFEIKPGEFMGQFEIEVTRTYYREGSVSKVLKEEL